MYYVIDIKIAIMRRSGYRPPIAIEDAIMRLLDNRPSGSHPNPPAGAGSP